jgi:hypothetical protein
MAHFPSAGLMSPEARGLNISVDTSRPGIVTVYLFCYET